MKERVEYKTRSGKSKVISGTATKSDIKRAEVKPKEVKSDASK